MHGNYSLATISRIGLDTGIDSAYLYHLRQLARRRNEHLSHLNVHQNKRIEWIELLSPLIVVRSTHSGHTARLAVGTNETGRCA